MIWGATLGSIGFRGQTRRQFRALSRGGEPAGNRASVCGSVGARVLPQAPVATRRRGRLYRRRAVRAQSSPLRAGARVSQEAIRPAVRSQSLTNSAPFLSPLTDCQECLRLEIPHTRGVPFQGQILALPAVSNVASASSPGGPMCSACFQGWAASREARPCVGERVTHGTVYQFTAN